MMKQITNPILRAIPNTITCLNLLFGCVAIVLALRGYADMAVYCIFASAVFDFFDGLSARLLKAYSETGKQIDSLADAVSFGVAPATLLHVKLHDLLLSAGKMTGGFDTISGWELLSFFPFIIALFAALRLARFNVDTRQTNHFIGLPTPACALLIAALTSLSAHGHSLVCWMDTWYSVTGMSVVLSALLVCNLPMFSIKFKNRQWHSNRVPGLFLLLCLLIIAGTLLSKQGIMLAVAIIFSSYIVLSFFLHLFSIKTK